MSTVVRINGAIPDAVLAGVTINYGRQKSEGAFPASTLSLSLLAADVSPLPVNVRDVVTIDVDGTRLFYGRVTDRGLSVSYATADRIGTIQDIIATGVLADFGRITIGSSTYPSELDGARAARVIGEAAPLPPSIDSVSGTISSIGYALDVFRSVGLDVIDAGTVTLIARAANVRTPRDIINNELDPSAPGVYETPSGTIGYADSSRRTKAGSSLTIPANVIDRALKLSSGISDVVNQAAVNYGSPVATVTQDEPLSQSLFGVIRRDIDTQLSNASDANALAKRLVESRSLPELNIEALVIDLENPNLHPSLRTALLAVPFGKSIKITGLDERLGLGGTAWSGFCEGWHAVIGENVHQLTLYVSARKLSIPLAQVDDIYTALNALTGSIDDLADLWASQMKINQISDTINSVTGTYDTAYTIGA